ncbi:hypothetical protein GLAREA_07861 [Glarea lozoyensis ATCC 20868]|uniref:Uncharacterized protein n=1 Tax=Glarea lozoyensis (strain ATCC 20868 / MF5171) TaxID=1116229 RepID=S3D2I3_GLAL2|nr:uncharacterized protein GLAREA_07861 [Glarea lozoyensis ATCC 20868]EPE32727.1 hypothetical protein GLAREA_07861 [Glarea lozoyensis ATCC 20868]
MPLVPDPLKTRAVRSSAQRVDHVDASPSPRAPTPPEDSVEVEQYKRARTQLLLTYLIFLCFIVGIYFSSVFTFLKKRNTRLAEPLKHTDYIINDRVSDDGKVNGLTLFTAVIGVLSFGFLGSVSIFFCEKFHKAKPRKWVQCVTNTIVAVVPLALLAAGIYFLFYMIDGDWKVLTNNMKGSCQGFDTQIKLDQKGRINPPYRYAPY